MSKPELRLTMRDVNLMRKAGAKFDVMLVPVLINDVTWYRIDLDMIPASGPTERATLLTTRRDEFVRRDLDRAVQQIRDHFPEAKDLRLALVTEEVEACEEVPS